MDGEHGRTSLVDTVEFSAAPVTLGELILFNKAKDGDTVAMATLVAGRAGIALEQLYQLELGDWMKLLEKFHAHMNAIGALTVAEMHNTIAAINIARQRGRK